MCGGAKGAYQKVLRVLESKKSGRVILYKKLLHNKDVIKYLTRRGAVFYDELPNDITGEDIAVIRAHGETKDFFNKLNERKINYIDCTCPKVKRIHSLIEQKDLEGYQIIIIGNKDHAEVCGSKGWCAGAVIVSSLADIKKIQNVKKDKNIFVIAQTTFNEDLFKKLSCALIKKFSAFKIEVHNSLCAAQRKIHDESCALAKQSNIMFVIGDGKSANTKELYKKCRRFCEDTILIESKDDFLAHCASANNSERCAAIGITGGASTPPQVISEFKYLLEWNEFYNLSRKKIVRRIEELTKIYIDGGGNSGQNTAGDCAYINFPLEQFSKIARSPKAKHIRGVLIALGYSIAISNKKKPHKDEWIDLSAAYELLETSILIHDDVFDKAASRRGEETIHKTLSVCYGTNAAQSAAVCSGDIGFYIVNKIIMESYKNHKMCFDVLLYLQNIVITTIKGELLDVLLPLEAKKNIFNDIPFLKSYLLKNSEQVNILKTACYTTVGPLTLGMILGGADKNSIKEMQNFAVELGVVFQLADDMRDIFGNGIGKPRGADIAEHKITTLYAYAASNPEYKNELSGCYGKKNTAKIINAVRQVFEESGACEAVNLDISRRLSKCGAALSKMNFLNSPHRGILLGFMTFLEAMLK